MPRMRIAIAALLCAAALPAARAASGTAGDIDLQRMGWLPSDVYDVGEGLPDPTVGAIAALPNGQVWIGTMRGLARQSGPRIVAEHGPDGALDDAIMDIAATRDGDLLVATAGHGTWRRHDGGWRALGKPFGDERVQRLRVFEDGTRQRVFAAGGGVAELLGDRWQAFALPPAMHGHDQFDVALQAAGGTRPGTLWIGNYGPPGLYRCPGERDCAPVPVPGPRSDIAHVLRLQALGDGRSALWIGLQGGGVARLLDGTWTRWHTGNSALPSDFIGDLVPMAAPGGESETWIGTRNGLAVLRGDDHWTQADPRVPLLHGRVQALALARNGQGEPVLWVGSDGGAARTPMQGPWHLVSTLGNKGNGILALRVERGADGGQRLWLGSDGEGLARFEHGQWRIFGTADGLPDDGIRSIVRVPDGSAEGALWLGTWGGHLARMQGEGFVELPTPWEKPNNEALSLLLVEPEGVWASTRRQGIAHWNGREWQWWPPGAGMPRRAYAAVRIGRDVWFSTSEQGLARYRDGHWRFFHTDIGLPVDALYDMRPIPGANGARLLWIGSKNNGLLRVDVSDPDRPRLVREPALPAFGVSVYGAVRDGRGDVLVCTDYGVFGLHREGDGFRTVGYHRVDGLPHDECNANAMQVDDEGRVWIGTVGGAAVYSPPLAPRHRRPSPLALVSVLVDGEPVAAGTGALGLPSAGSVVDLEYELLDGEKEDGNRYRVSLVGTDGSPQWESANSHRFARLPAGPQRILVEAKDAAGIAAKPIELQLDVPQAWWRTPMTRALIALAVLVLLWSLLKLRGRRLRLREERLRGMVQEQTAQLHEREAELRAANDELLRLSYTDALTGLGNRRRLFETLELHCRDAARNGESLALLLIDLDRFKQFNDAHGHLAGDARLQQVARLVQSRLPAGASAARYGGEELCVLLPGCDAPAAMRIAERMRRAIAVLPADTALPEIEGLAVTVSIGVAAGVPGLEQRPDVLVARADRALYAAKAAGRNRVECDGG